MSLRRRLCEVRLAMMMLTRLPMGQLPAPVPSMAEVRWAFPLAGVPVALLGWGAFVAGGALGLPPLAAALMALAAMAALTGGLHHDGLADFVDGMGGRDRAHRLEIMRDSRIGSYGVLALLFAVALSASALSELPATAWAGVLLVATASRFAMLIVLDRLPAARADGLGHMAIKDRQGPQWTVWLPAALLCLILSLVVGWAALPVLMTISLAGLFIAWRARHLLGGQTGDVLGAVQLTSETAGLLVLSAAL